MSTTDPRVEQQQAAHGGVKVGAAFLGMVTAIGMVVVLGGLLSAVVVVLGLSGQGFFGVGEAELQVGGAVVGTVVLLVSWTTGGYVAARMARFHGARQGLAVWGWTVVVLLAAVGLGALTGTSPAGTALLPTGGELAVLLAVVLGAPALLTLVGALLGGVLGMRFHRRVDRTGALDAHSVASGS